ncbi:MAG: hypothetical protein Q9211_002669 [Gyalolechia sp. 1 TL-2023]
MADSNIGDAIFSTDLGRWAPRDPALMPPRIILRSDPTEDMEVKIAELQARYPSQCKAMKAPITNIHDYFDTYDQQLHGQMFLHTVLMEICLQNTLRKNAILDYSEAWTRLNSAAFECIDKFELDAFTDDDLEEYGEDFLRDVLQLLQLRKTKQDEAALLATDRPRMQTQDRVPQANTGPFAVFPPQDHELGRPIQRNSSAPTSSHTSFAQPQLTPSLPSSTPGLAHVFMPNPPIPLPPQRLESANNRPVEPPLRSAPLYYSRRGEHYSDPTDSGINIPKSGFSDTIVAVPPLGSMQGPFLFHRMPAGPRAFHYPSNKSRTLPRIKAPVYVGPSNDARVLEKQGIPRHGGSFGEGRVNRIFPQPYAQQGSYSNAYGPFQPNQPYGFSPERLPQGTKYPFSRSNNAVNRGMPLGRNRPSESTEQESFRINQHASISPNADGSNAFSEGDDVVQQYPLTRPRHRQDTFHEPQYAERDVFPDLTPPNRAQRQCSALQTNSPTARRFSSASVRPSETTPRTHDMGEYQFDMPHKAADAIVTLNEQYVDDLQYKIFLKPAHIRPPFDGDDGSPKKTDPRANRRSDHRELIDRDNEEKMRAIPTSFEADAQAPSSLPLEESDRPLQKRNQFGAEWPALGTNTSYPGQTPQSPTDVQSHLSQDTPKQRASSQVSGLGDREIAKGHKLANSQGNAATRVAYRSTKAAGNDFPSRKSKTPSPKKKNNRNATKDESTKGKTNQAKQRKEMLSSLRTEKLNAAASSSVPHTPVLGNDQQVHNYNEASSVSNREKPSGNEGTVAEHAPIHPSTLENDTEVAVTAQSELCGVQVSPAHSASTHERKLSSASVVLSTDPTSYAQSEYSETGTVGFQTSSYQDQDGSPPSIQVAPTEHVDVSKVDHMLGDAAATKLPGRDRTPDVARQVVVQPSNDQSSTATSAHGPDVTSTEVPPPDDEIATNDEQDMSLTIGAELSLSDNPGSIAATPSNLKVESRGEKAEAASTHDAVQSGQSAGTSNKNQVPWNVPADDHAIPSGDTSLKAPTQAKLNQPSIAQPQHATSPASKRGPLKDPKVLVAVPRILPLVRLKPQSRETHGHESKTATQPAASVGSLNETRGGDRDKESVCDESQGNLDAPSVSSAGAEKGPPPEPRAAPKLEGVPVLLLDAEKSSYKGTGLDSESKNNDGASKFTSVYNSIATIDDDRLDPDTSTPQSFAAAIIDLAKDESERSLSEQQPAIQQKKPKTKKGKKKSKKSKTSQTDSPADGNNKSQPESSAIQKEQTTNVVQVETPFLSDDKQPLPRPTFAIQNHSSMRSRNAQRLRNQSLSSSTASPLDKNGEENYLLVVVNSTKETGEQGGTSAQIEPQVSENVQAQTADYETREIGVLSEGYEPPNMADETTHEGRAKYIVDYVTINHPETQDGILETIGLRSPHERTGKLEGSSNLPKVGFKTLHEMNGPRVEEISSGDNVQPVSPPMAPLKQREQRLLPSRDVSPAGTATEDSSQVTEEQQDTSGAPQGDGISISTKLDPESFPRTRRTSTERGRLRSVSPAKGLGLSIVRPSSNNAENISPSKQARKILSYKQVASTPSFLPGEIVEITSKESNQEGKEGQGVTMVRKTGSKDLWRVPSSEQPWGGNNKAKRIPSTEASEGAK